MLPHRSTYTAYCWKQPDVVVTGWDGREIDFTMGKIVCTFVFAIVNFLLFVNESRNLWDLDQLSKARYCTIQLDCRLGEPV